MDWKKLLNDGRFRDTTRIKGVDTRNEFESDFGRIIFSSAMRRMHDKTQVYPLTFDDNIHSRLTHSLEVMALGYSLGVRICEDKRFTKIKGEITIDTFRKIPVILKNACLVHDIGNPPFGHFGETVISTYFKKFFTTDRELERKNKKTNYDLNNLQKKDFEEFDGNAQGFRVLTKLQTLNDEYGLNLTYSTLGTYLKYPNANLIDKTISNKKRGVFQTEINQLHTIVKECGMFNNDKIIRHPLCYLMEAADTICYLIMDIEDGFNKHWYDFGYLFEKLKKIEGVFEAVEKIKEKKLNGYGNEITLMVNFRIYLISRLIDLVVENFYDNFDSIKKGNYDHELVYEDKTNLAITLKDFCYSNIFPNSEITSLELTGHSVLTGLLNYYIGFVFNKEKEYRYKAQSLISNSILRAAFIENKLPEDSKIEHLNDYYKLRVIVDYISGMTDQYALNHYQKLSGQKII